MEMMKIATRTAILLLFVFPSLFLATGADAQRSPDYEKYIREYREIAMREMRNHKIPASITLAQGLLESGAGRTELARNARNHFGIKCAGDWKGARTYHDDDARNECFRSYRSAADSYEDHSRFLQRSRYAPLFELKITDYKGWARGLKACGYATDPQYAAKLIRLIEDYDLARYDRQVLAAGHGNIYTGSHDLFRFNGLLYIVALGGDDLASLSREFKISARKLRKYNDFPSGYRLRPGDLVYLCAKKRKPARQYRLHIVADGDSWHSISQKYGVRLQSLVKRNPQVAGGRLRPGEQVRLR